jgi:hypothetical protein
MFVIFRIVKHRNHLSYQFLRIRSFNFYNLIDVVFEALNLRLRHTRLHYKIGTR